MAGLKQLKQPIIYRLILALADSALVAPSLWLEITCLEPAMMQCRAGVVPVLIGTCQERPGSRESGRLSTAISAFPAYLADKYFRCP